MKIAIVKLSALGDIVHAMAALQFIKGIHPHSEIDWIVEAKFKGILEGNREINNIFTVSLHDAKKEKSLLLLYRELRKIRKLKGYDFVFDAQGLIKSAIVSKMISSKKIIGFDRKSIREPLASMFYNEKVSIPYNQNAITRNVNLLCGSININVKSSQIIEKKTFLFSSKKNSISHDGYCVLVVGSTWDSRNYPKEKFVGIAEKLKRKCIVIWGNNRERSKAEWMSHQSKYIKVSPKLNLNELKALINYADLVIGNDTGPTHIAWGMNKPSITLFGPTPINRVYQTPINRVIKSSSKVNHFSLNKNDFSIKEIKVDEVVKIAEEILEKKI
jgi:heptosyltransferase-1